MACEFNPHAREFFALCRRQVVISERKNREGGGSAADAWAGWRGQSHTTRRRLWTWLLVSSALHAPLTPLVALLGLVGLLDMRTDDAPPAPPITEIPLDLLPDDGPDPAPKAADKALAEPGGAPVPAPPKPKEAKVEAADAGAPSDAGADSGDAEAVAQAAAEGGVEGREKGTGEQIGDPVALSGAAGKIADANANIRLILYTERMRAHPLARRVGSMLSQAYQWRDFFGPSGIDPIQDVDRILIAGPELRDSSQVVAVMQYNVSDERMRAAVDALVQRDTSGGEWLDAGAPAARARADRADRLFVMPAPHLIVVTPPSAERHALSLSPKTRFPRAAGDEAVTAYILKPSQSLRGLPLRLPASLKWLRIKARQAEGGGATVHIHGLDETPELAEHHAQMLQEGVTAMSRLDLGMLGLLLGRSETRFIESVEFTADGRNIRGELGLTEQQLGSIVDLLTQLMGGAPRRPPPQPALEAGTETPSERPVEPSSPEPPSLPPVPEVPVPEPPAVPSP